MGAFDVVGRCVPAQDTDCIASYSGSFVMPREFHVLDVEQRRPLAGSLVDIFSRTCAGGVLKWALGSHSQVGCIFFQAVKNIVAYIPIVEGQAVNSYVLGKEWGIVLQ